MKRVPTPVPGSGGDAGSMAEDSASAAGAPANVNSADGGRTTTNEAPSSSPPAVGDATTTQTASRARFSAEDKLKAFQVMADRRGAQLAKERADRATERARLEAENVTLRTANQEFLGRLPQFKQSVDELKKAREEAAATAAENRKLKLVNGQAVAQGFRPDDAAVKALEEKDGEERRYDMLTRSILQLNDTVASLQRQPKSVPSQQAPTPAQVSVEEQNRAATAHFQSEIHELETALPSLAPFRQLIMNAWWEAGGRLSVDEAAEAFVKTAELTEKGRLLEKAERAETYPRVPGTSVAHAPSSPSMPDRPKVRSTDDVTQRLRQGAYRQ